MQELNIFFVNEKSIFFFFCSCSPYFPCGYVSWLRSCNQSSLCMHFSLSNGTNTTVCISRPMCVCMRMSWSAYKEIAWGITVLFGKCIKYKDVKIFSSFIPTSICMCEWDIQMNKYALFSRLVYLFCFLLLQLHKFSFVCLIFTCKL